MAVADLGCMGLDITAHIGAKPCTDEQAAALAASDNPRDAAYYVIELDDPDQSGGVIMHWPVGADGLLPL